MVGGVGGLAFDVGTGEPEVWGICITAIGVRAQSQHSPTYFSVRVLRAGTFTDHLDEQLVLLFCRDHARFFDRANDLMGRLCGALVYRDSQDLVRLAQGMLAHSHGGTILVVRSMAAAQGLSLHHAFSVEDGEHTLLKEALAQHEGTLPVPPRGSDPDHVIHLKQPEEQHDEALDFVARLRPSTERSSCVTT